MGTRKQRERQADPWIASAEIAETSGHAFYERLNELFSEDRLEARWEHMCQRFYRRQYGQPCMAGMTTHTRRSDFRYALEGAFTDS